MSTRYLDLAPSNKTTDQKYSFKKGVAQLQFQIPPGNYLLDPSSVRIVGKVQYFNDTNGTQIGAQADINQRIGVYAHFQQIIWRSLKHQTTIEHLKHYNTWISSYFGASSGVEDSLTHLSESALTLPNYEQIRKTVVRKTEPNSFAVHLPCGMLNSGAPINLMDNALGGCELVIMLESDANSINILPADTTTVPDTTGYSDVMYELSDVKLVCSVITPPPDQLSQLMKQTQGSFTFQSIHSFYDTFNSTNMQVNMLFGLSRVKSLYMTFIESSKLNNLGADGLSTLPPTNLDGSQAFIKKINWLKGGRSYPKLYPLETNREKDSKVILNDPEVAKDYINSIIPWGRAKTISMSPATNNRDIVGKINASGSLPYQFVNDTGMVYAVGINYENFIGSSGVPFDKESFGVAIDCDLNSNSAQSVFIFVNAETTIVYNQNGVQAVM